MTDEGTEQIAEAITEYWGERCPDFDPDCACCKTWLVFDTLVGHKFQPNAPGIIGSDLCTVCGKEFEDHTLTPEEN